MVQVTVQLPDEIAQQFGRVPEEMPSRISELFQRDLDLEAFEKFLPQLLESNRGHFVAIADGKVVDRDPDELRLVERICRERPGQRVLVQRVLDRVLEEVHMDTPEFDFAKGQAG